MKNLKIVYYNDGLTVEDEIGNKIFVQDEVLSENNREAHNTLAFALGKLFLDAMYCKRVDTTWEQEFKKENYVSLAH